MKVGYQPQDCSIEVLHTSLASCTCYMFKYRLHISLNYNYKKTLSTAYGE